MIWVTIIKGLEIRWIPTSPAKNWSSMTWFGVPTQSIERQAAWIPHHWPCGGPQKRCSCNLASAKIVHQESFFWTQMRGEYVAKWLSEFSLLIYISDMYNIYYIYIYYRYVDICLIACEYYIYIMYGISPVMYGPCMDYLWMSQNNLYRMYIQVACWSCWIRGKIAFKMKWVYKARLFAGWWCNFTMVFIVINSGL